MIELNLSLHRKARIWIGEFPFSDFHSTVDLKENLYKTGKSFKEANSGKIAIELYIPTGGRIIYGLLGADFTSHYSNSFVVKVHSSRQDKEVFNSSICNWLNDVYIGLPLTYAKSVQKEVLRYFEKKQLPKGQIVFSCAAFSEMDSSQNAFERITKIICDYFFSDQTFEKDEDFYDLFPAT